MVFETVAEAVSATEARKQRVHPGDFSRDGVLFLSLLVTLLLYVFGDANRRGYVRLPEGFWDECRSFDIQLPTEEAVSGAAFCRVWLSS